MHFELFTTERWLQARPWLFALAASLAAHAWLFQSGTTMPPQASEQARSGSGATALRVRTLPDQAAAKSPAEPPRPAQSQAPRRPSQQPTAEAQPSAPPAVLTPPLPAAPAATAPAARLAAAGEWHYILLQNGMYGRARLDWQPSERGYTLMLERELEGRPLPAWKSQGQLDEQGLNPERYVQQRRGRDMTATNFRREEGLISFSGGSELVPLPEGVQDRLSWWIQLAALIEAAPERYPPGSELRLPVVALRGEAREWRFEVLDQQTLELPGASIARALHLRRLPPGPYGGEIELWLDPARGHIPVQLIWNLPDDRGWQLQLSPGAGKP